MRHIVLADDSKTIQKVIKLSFADAEYEVHCFENGTSALEHVRRRGADIVLADVALPVLDGYELCRELKQDPRTSDLPIVLLAGTLEPFDSDRAARVNCDGSLTKPFEISQLVEVVGSLAPSEDISESQVLSQNAGSGLGPPRDEGLFQPPVVSVSGKMLFSLSGEECKSSVTPLTQEVVRETPKQDPSMSDKQFNALVDEVSKRLPDALKEILPKLKDGILED